MRPALGALIACLLVDFVSAGCIVAQVDQGPFENFTTWSSTPLPPDAGLTAAAADPNGSCTAGPGGEPVALVLQDRRTEWTAGFIFRGATTFGSCIVTSAQGASSGGSGPSPVPFGEALSIDINGFGDAGGGTAHELGGQVEPEITSVLIALSDGRTVTASVGSGYWLAWWPTDAAATTVTGFDEAGAEVVTVEAP